MTFAWAHAVAAVALLAWLYLIWGRGGFWRADQRLDPMPPPHREHWPGVAVVIPARDEAPTVARAVSSLLRQDYPGACDVIVVDDASTDGTGAAARSAGEENGRAHVIEGAPLPAGWSGKLWAVHQGLQRADTVAPEAAYVLLADADIEHDPQSLRRLVGKAEAGGYDLVSLMVLLRCRHFWERFLIPAFVFFFQKLYPFARVNDPKRKEAAAAGGCMLVRRAALARIGGVESLRDRLIDDCALAEAVKRGGPIWLGLTRDVASLRDYTKLGDVWRMVARSAFAQLDNSVWWLVLTVAGMVLIYIVPPAASVGGLWLGDLALILSGLTAYALMLAAFRPTLALYGLAWPWGLLLPGAAALYTMMTFDSALRTWRGRGGAWKGRFYDRLGQSG